MKTFQQWLEANDWQDTSNWQHLYQKSAAKELGGLFYKVAWKRFTPEERERIEKLALRNVTARGTMPGQPDYEEKYEREKEFLIRWAAEVKSERPANAFSGVDKNPSFADSDSGWSKHIGN
jgi:hypothetical protein